MIRVLLLLFLIVQQISAEELLLASKVVLETAPVEANYIINNADKDFFVKASWKKEKKESREYYNFFAKIDLPITSQIFYVLELKTKSSSKYVGPSVLNLNSDIHSLGLERLKSKINEISKELGTTKKEYNKLSAGVLRLKKDAKLIGQFAKFEEANRKNRSAEIYLKALKENNLFRQTLLDEGFDTSSNPLLSNQLNVLNSDLGLLRAKLKEDNFHTDEVVESEESLRSELARLKEERKLLEDELSGTLR